MVCVNFRIEYGIKNERIIDFFKEIGYSYRRLNKKSVSVEEIFISTEEFIRKTNSGQFHLFISFGQKYSGSEGYPQVKVFLHYDIIKRINGKEKHIPDSNERRNLKEIYRIEKEMIKRYIGFLEEKYRNCAHLTLKITYKDKLMEIIRKEYIRYDKGKFRRKLNNSQFVISIIDQNPYIHIICVYAKIVNRNHILKKKMSEKEIQRIKGLIKN